MLWWPYRWDTFRSPVTADLIGEKRGDRRIQLKTNGFCVFVLFLWGINAGGSQVDQCLCVIYERIICVNCICMYDNGIWRTALSICLILCLDMLGAPPERTEKVARRTGKENTSAKIFASLIGTASEATRSRTVPALYWGGHGLCRHWYAAVNFDICYLSRLLRNISFDA